MPHLPTPAYGADAAGLICGYRIAPDVATQAIDSASAAARLAATSEADGSFLWRHFNLAHTGARPWWPLTRHCPTNSSRWWTMACTRRASNAPSSR